MADGTSSKKSTVRGRARKRGFTPQGDSRKRAARTTQSLRTAPKASRTVAKSFAGLNRRR